MFKSIVFLISFFMFSINKLFYKSIVADDTQQGKQKRAKYQEYDYYPP